VLEPSLPWHADNPYGASVSNPCVIQADRRWVLYYSAGLTHVADCGLRNQPLLEPLLQRVSQDHTSQ